MQDTIILESQWRFDANVTRVFDDMLQRSIPQYQVMRDTCFALGQRYVQDDSFIIDLGTSRGEALSPFVEYFGAKNKYIGIESSEAMYYAARTRFAGNEQVIIRHSDLRESFPGECASVILSVLTLQFIPIDYRQRLVQQVYNNLLPGGAFIFVEKVLGQNDRINQTMVKAYHQLKHANGYTTEQINRKRLSLEGVLIPVTAKWNEELLQMAGFRSVDCFWRWLNFAGWIAIKD